MEMAVYRQTTAGRKVNRALTNEKQIERRRVIQLTVSLIIFAVVFIGREAFPKLCGNLEKMIGQDAVFSEIAADVRKSVAEDFGISDVLQGLVSKESGSEPPAVENNFPDETEQPMIEHITITPLSEMEQIGLEYYKEHGLRKQSEEMDELIDQKEPDIEVSEPEIVTAVAQPYNERGESLPRNVSYQYYELGLEKTVVPVIGEVTSGFDYRISPITGQREFHLALDIAAAKGTEITAFADGVVRYIGESDDFGLYFMIDHANGVATFYAHCSKLLVRKGEAVTCGQTVALVGDTGNATGPHLHFTIEKDNIRLDPAYYVNP